MADVATLMQFILEGDYLGFIQAVYVCAFQSADLFYGVVTMIGSVALYIRSQSLILMSIIWLLLGTFFYVAMPILGGLALFLWVFGTTGTLFKLYTQLRG